jgi:fructokinase
MSVAVVGLGEVLWDLLPGGRQLGGAPANFAYHAAALGARAAVVSRVGRDAVGRDLLDRLQAFGLDVAGVEIDPAAPTSTVSVALGADGQPRYVIHENVAWDRLAGSAAAHAAVARADVLCFGTLAQRAPAARAALLGLVAAARPDALRVFDVNLRQHYHAPEVIAASLARADVLKINDAELPVLAAQFGLGGDERAQLAALAARFPLRAVAFTRGARGSVLFAGGTWSELRGETVAVADTVGAGDSFTAALALGLVAGWTLDLVHRRAVALAAYVCTQPGGTPPLPVELTAPFRGLAPASGGPRA